LIDGLCFIFAVHVSQRNVIDREHNKNHNGSCIISNIRSGTATQCVMNTKHYKYQAWRLISVCYTAQSSYKSHTSQRFKCRAP